MTRSLRGGLGSAMHRLATLASHPGTRTKPPVQGQRRKTAKRTGSLRTKSGRHRVDHGTICGRSCANSGHYKPICACIDRTFVNSNSARRPTEFFFLAEQARDWSGKPAPLGRQKGKSLVGQPWGHVGSNVRFAKAAIESGHRTLRKCNPGDRRCRRQR